MHGPGTPFMEPGGLLAVTGAWEAPLPAALLTQGNGGMGGHTPHLLEHLDGFQTTASQEQNPANPK